MVLKYQGYIYLEVILNTLLIHRDDSHNCKDEVRIIENMVKERKKERKKEKKNREGDE